MNLKQYLFLLFCLISNIVIGQFNNLKFENFDTIDGLSSSTCTDIFQDKEGFMWFGTIDGLNKYNGYEFEVFRSVVGDSETISNNRINTIQEDNEGNIWVGTNNGLNFFNKRTGKFSHINLYKQVSLSNSSKKNINDLLYDSINNIIWVATNNGAIKIILGDDNVNTKNYNFSYYINDQSNPKSIDNNGVNVILKDVDNTIWIGTDGKHLNKYNPLENNFERIFIKNKQPYALNHIPKRIFIDADGDFWIGNDLNNLILWERDKNLFSHISLVDNHIPIFKIFQDNKGLFWVPTEGKGLFLLKKKEGKITIQQHFENNISNPFSLPNNKISKVFQDKNDIYWIGSYDKGVSKLDLTKYSFGHYYYQQGNNDGLSAQIVQSVLQDHKKRIWISSYNGGIDLFDEKNNTFKKNITNNKSKNSLSSDKILYTFESHDGYIWVCTLDGGLNRFDPENNKVEQFLHNSKDSLSIGQNSVWAGIEDSKNRIWLALRTEGISMYNPKTKNFTNYKNNYNNKTNLVSNNILCVFIDSKNRLLIGTSLGVNYVDLSTLKDFTPSEIQFKEVKQNKVQDNWINYITEDHLGNIWVGTDSGIHQLDSDFNLIKSYTSQDGLPNNLVVGIVEDNNYNFWITTKGGLSFLNSKTQKFKNYNVHDGLQGTEFQSKSIDKTLDGRILIGGINGFNIFNPNEIDATEPKVLTPRITTFKLNNKKVTAGDSINGRVLLNKSISVTKNLELQYNENYITFEFLSLYFENPEQIQYAYKMEGIDKDFINIGSNRVVNHSNLQAGDYTFKLKSTINGQWDKSKVTSINLKILPPIWRTWWAYLLYFLSGTILFIGVLQYYTLKVKESQEHELDQMKLKFFINVSHEFRTPLTLILNPVDKILSRHTDDSDEVKNSAITIQRSARRLLHLVNQLLDYRKMDVGMAPIQFEKGDIINFSREIFCLFKDLAAKKEIEYKFKTSLTTINSLFDFDKVEKIITNLISNAIKFTNNDGQITVSINKVKAAKKKSKISIFKKEKLSDFVEIIVEDTGIGLNKEQIKNVFSRFYNLDITKAGTGIGLNFTKGLVELHGGEIIIESEHLKGSKFTVRLPLNIKAQPEEVVNIKNEFLINSMKAVEYDMLISNDSLKNETEKETLALDAKKRPTILIVEDNNELRKHLTNDLKDSYIIKEASNGVNGLKMIKKHYPDIVISDVMMPKMDGFEMCRQIKTEFETCHIPVLLLTARTLEEDRIQGYDNGADGYIAKPFVTSLLRARINNLLETKKRLRERFSKIGGAISSNDSNTSNIDEVFLDKATKIILDNISDIDFKQDNLLKEMGIGRSQFYRKINALTELNPSGYIRSIRLRHASELLLQKQYSIKEITHMCGFNSTAYFSKTFKELFNVTPTQFMEQDGKK